MGQSEKILFVFHHSYIKKNHIQVYKAVDKQQNRTVAIKIQPYDEDTQNYINEEYRVLRDFSTHQNLPEFLGVYRKRNDTENSDIWFVLEVRLFCAKIIFVILF